MSVRSDEQAHDALVYLLGMAARRMNDAHYMWTVTSEFRKSDASATPEGAVHLRRLELITQKLFMVVEMEKTLAKLNKYAQVKASPT